MPFRVFLTKADGLPLRLPARVRPPALMRRAELLVEMIRLGAGTWAAPPDSGFWLPLAHTKEPGCRAIVMQGERGAPITPTSFRILSSSEASTTRFLISNSRSAFRILSSSEASTTCFASRSAWRSRTAGRVFIEDDAGTELTRENLDVLLAPRGAFMPRLREFWRPIQFSLGLEGRAFLEFPLGSLDDVPDYFRFEWHMRGVPSLPALLENTPDHLSIEAHGRWAGPLGWFGDLRERATGQSLARIEVHPDAVVVRPKWTAAPFAQQAHEVLSAVARIEALVGGPPLYFGSPSPRAEREELARHATGLGVSYYAWLRDSGRMQPTPTQSAQMAGEGIAASLAAARANERRAPLATEVRLVLAKRHTFDDVVDCMGRFGCERVDPAATAKLTAEPSAVTWRTADTTLRYRFDEECQLRTIHLEGPSAQILSNDIVNVAYMSTFSTLADELAAPSERDVLFALRALQFRGRMAIGERAGVAAARRHGDPRIAQVAEDTWRRVSPPATRGIVGVGFQAGWTTDVAGAVHAVASEDDFRVDPETGLAVLVSGRGAIGHQGRPGAVLGLWSLVGEVRAAQKRGDDADGGTQLEVAFRRAHEAVGRTTWSWRGAIPPTISAAAVLLDADHVRVGHIGKCRVSRLRPGMLAPITTDHTLGAEMAAAGIPPDPTVASIPTRALGQGEAAHEMRAYRVEDGDWLFLANGAVHSALSDDEIGAILFPVPPDGDVAADPLSHATALLNRLVASVATGSVAFAIIGVRDRPIPQVSVGSSMEPAPSWLYRPGSPLPEPPPDWTQETGSNGPDARWETEIASALLGVAPSAKLP